MSNDEIVFVINMRETIRVLLPCELDDIIRHDDVFALYTRDGVDMYTLFAYNVILEFLNMLDGHLRSALLGNKKLYSSLQQDLGYLWNEYLVGGSDRSKFEYKLSPEMRKYWVGKDFMVWCGQDVATWLYEKDGVFWLEITPSYKWHFLEPAPEESNYITYDEFIKNYKPHVMIELSIDIMKKWLRQTERLIAQVVFNDDKFVVKDDGMV